VLNVSTVIVWGPVAEATSLASAVAFGVPTIAQLVRTFEVFGLVTE
jgi:hypothetical protein